VKTFLRWTFCASRAAEKQIICDLSTEGRVAEAVMLLCVYFVFNYDYSIQRNSMLIFQTIMLSSVNVKLPVSLSQLFADLQDAE
jgi:hypothetical protein